MFSDIIQGLRELAFPDNCLVCRTFLNSRHTRQLCPACFAKIQRNLPPFCPLCSRHVAHFTDDGICAACRVSHHAYDRAWSACFYEEALRPLVHAYKYNGKTALRKTFVAIMTEFIDTYAVPIQNFDMLIPIPLHPVRRRERGFNQSQLLSSEIARRYQVPHREDIVKRIRPTVPQANLDQKQRWTNLEGAFKIQHSDAVREQSILLVDDLLTTGATAHAAAACLKDAGAAHIGILTLAITR